MNMSRILRATGHLAVAGSLRLGGRRDRADEADFDVIEVGTRGEVTFTEDEISLPAFGKALAELALS